MTPQGRFSAILMEIYPKKTTIHDIARELGLTGSTVSRALNDHPRISEATKELVRQKAIELDYRPNHIAARLRMGKTHTIGLIVPRINRTFFANVIHGIEMITSQAGYHLLICQSNEQLSKEIANLDTLRSSRVDGVIISLSAETSDASHFDSMLKAGIPMVQFDRVLDSLPVPQVVNDDDAAAYALVRHMIDQGYRRIVHYGGPQYLSLYRNRYEGYRRAMAEAGLEISTNTPPIYALSQEQGLAVTRDLFSAVHRPDAIFSASDYAALGAIHALQELQLRVPEEVGVAGYANEPFTALIHPAITSVEQFGEEMGRQAATLLLDLLAPPSGPVPVVAQPVIQQVKVIPKVLYRASTQKKP